MAKQTIAQSLIEGLTALGYKEVYPPRQSARYRIFSDPNRPKYPSGKARYFFVGQNGAFRVGHNSTYSTACNDTFRTKVLEAKSKALKEAFADLI